MTDGIKVGHENLWPLKVGRGTRNRLATARNWAAKICGSWKWATARNRLKTTDLAYVPAKIQRLGMSDFFHV